MNVRLDSDEFVIIEVQVERGSDFFQRILYGTSKVITEHMSAGNIYKDVAKVISVNMLYFDLGEGDDYVYYGKASFRGIHRKDTLDEWIYFLKHDDIRAEFTAKGLAKAKEVLDVLTLPAAERAAYERYVEDMRLRDSIAVTNYLEGTIDGKIEVARNLLDVLDHKAIAKASGLTEDEVSALRLSSC